MRWFVSNPTSATGSEGPQTSSDPSQVNNLAPQFGALLTGSESRLIRIGDYVAHQTEGVPSWRETLESPQSQVVLQRMDQLFRRPAE
jgi:hypothetical protein